MNDERCQKPLLNDIWQFHQAEKLYILRIIKEILTQKCSTDSTSRHFEVYNDIFAELDKNGQLKDSLIKQFQSLIEINPPTKDKFYTSDTIQAWAHFNLRQQCEVLQILLLYFHQCEKIEGEDVLNLLKLFTSHRFGTKKIVENNDKNLVESIGYLESSLIVYLLELPTLANISEVEEIAQHSIWKKPQLIQELDRSIGSNLGTLRYIKSHHSETQFSDFT